MIDKISDKDIIEFNIPTGIPLVYEFDENLTPLKKYYLAPKDVVDKKMSDVKNQGKIKA